MGKRPKQSKSKPASAPKAPATSPAPAEAAPPSSESRDFYPDRTSYVKEPAVASHGLHETADGFPDGAVIHYTGGGGLDGTLESLIRDGYGYHLLIERDGTIYQLAPLSARLAHAGKSSWGSRRPALTFCGIALANYGFLRERAGEFWAWPGDWKKVNVPESRVRMGGSHVSPKKLIPWEAATELQIRALVNVCLWLVSQGVPADNFAGHDEVSGSGKMDPGGCLPFPCANLREFLRRHGHVGQVAWARQSGDPDLGDSIRDLAGAVPPGAALASAKEGEA